MFGQLSPQHGVCLCSLWWSVILATLVRCCVSGLHSLLKVLSSAFFTVHLMLHFNLNHVSRLEPIIIGSCAYIQYITDRFIKPQILVGKDLTNPLEMILSLSVATKHSTTSVNSLMLPELDWNMSHTHASCGVASDCAVQRAGIEGEDSALILFQLRNKPMPCSDTNSNIHEDAGP